MATGASDAGRTIGFLHTSPVHVDTFEALVRQRDPDAETVHCVSSTLLDQARTDGPTDAVVAGVLAGLEHLTDESCDVIVCTCSTLGTIAESLQSRLGSVTILRVDRPMARAAVAVAVAGAGQPTRIGVVAALESTLAPTRELLEDEALRARRQVHIHEVLLMDAWASFESGDRVAYLRDVADAARDLGTSTDVVVLAQASMAPAVDQLSDLPVPVLASPGSAVDAALRAVAAIR